MAGDAHSRWLGHRHSAASPRALSTLGFWGQKGQHWVVPGAEAIRKQISNTLREGVVGVAFPKKKLKS